MYSLATGFRIPVLQYGLSPTESLLTKINGGALAAAIAAAALSPPPAAWPFGVVGAGAALLNAAPGPRSIARWGAVGYRRLREHTAPASMTAARGETVTWELYPDHGTMQNPAKRASFHAAVDQALRFVSDQARTAGIQVHVTHHAITGDYTTHTQTVSVHIPKGLVASPARVLETLEDEFAGLGALMRVEPEPIPTVTEQGSGWVALDDDRYASTARITGWPPRDDGTLIRKFLLGDERPPRDAARDVVPERSMAVLYRPLTQRRSRWLTRIQEAANGAFTTDPIEKEKIAIESDGRHDAMVAGEVLVDVDAYITVWGHNPDSVSAARWTMTRLADRHRIRLDWLAGQQHRAHVMTSAHAVSTRKGSVL
ncbi:hypothetical protein AB0M94_39485 [Streptomyces xanthochromogenes]|uniref:hypothetical protein n=1 Tax=Streptomyces xanthochromogenes TaxID=67384 RepID=UPI003419523D